MRVLMFGWEFPPHIAGGLGTACYGLTRALMSAGVEVTFVVPKAYGDEDQSYIKLKNASEVEAEYNSLWNTNGNKGEEYDEFVKQLKFIHINSNLVPYISPDEYDKMYQEHKKINHKKEGTPLKQSGDIWKERYNFSGTYGGSLMEEVARYALVAAQIAKDLEGQYDIIHAHDWLTYYAGIAAKKVSGKPLVVHMHATEFDRSGENVNSVVYDIERTGMQAADMVCAVSNLTRQICIEKYGIPSHKVKTVHNGVLFSTNTKEEKLEKNLPNDKIVTFLGRITYQKGPDYFVEAAAKVLAKIDNVRFVMAGSGDLLNHVVRRVAKLGIANRFHFTGFLKGDEVKKMFALSDIYIMPSVSEPFGISPLEAMRSNVPCIISKQSGVAEVLDYAIKVDYWDVDAMADAIYGLLKYPSASKLFKERGQSEVSEIRWDNAANILKEIYQSLV